MKNIYSKIDTFVEKAGRMTLHFFKGHCYWQLIYLSGEMRLDIKTNINSWVFNRDALSAGLIEMTLMTLGTS